MVVVRKVCSRRGEGDFEKGGKYQSWPENKYTRLSVN